MPPGAFDQVVIITTERIAKQERPSRIRPRGLRAACVNRWVVCRYKEKKQRISFPEGYHPNFGKDVGGWISKSLVTVSRSWMENLTG